MENPKSAYENHTRSNCQNHEDEEEFFSHCTYRGIDEKHHERANRTTTDQLGGKCLLAPYKTASLDNNFSV